MEDKDKKQDNEVLLGIVEELQNKNLSTLKLIQRIRDIINNHAQNMHEPYKTRDIIDSRFMQTGKAYRWGVTECGGMVNIATFILRNLGREVKKIHGSIPTAETHAWLKVKEGEDWKEYDFITDDCSPSGGRVIKNECDDWEEIKPIIEEASRIELEGEKKQAFVEKSVPPSG